MPTALEHKNEGNEFYLKKNYSAAIASYENAIALEPTLPEAWHNKGLCHVALGEKEFALEAFDKAIQYKPNYAKAKWSKAKLLEEAERVSEAWLLLSDLLLDPALDKKFRKTAALQKFKLSQQHQSKFIFACVDLKYTAEGKVKVLEFGLGSQSGSSALDVMGQPPIDEALRKAMHKYTLPSVFMNSYPGEVRGSRHDLFEQYLGDLPQRSVAPDFMKFSPEDLIYGGFEVREQAGAFLMDDPNLRFAFGNKAYIDDVFRETELTEYRPKSMTFPRKYLPDLAARIQAKIPGEHYVIKAPDVERGTGVAIVTRAELDDVLKLLLTSESFQSNSKFLRNIKPAVLQRMNEFFSIRDSQSYRFMVEEYVPSQSIEYKEQQYDATARSFFLYVRSEGKGRFIPVASYWKIPPQPISASSRSLRDRVVSSFSANRIDAAPLASEDEASVNAALSTIVPAVFEQLMRLDYFDQIGRINFPGTERYGRSMEWVNYSNAFAFQGNADLAQACLDNIKRHEIEAWRLPHQQAIVDYAKGDISTAIEGFKQVLTVDPQVNPAYFRLFRIYAELGDQQAYHKLFRQMPFHLRHAMQGQLTLLQNPRPIFIASQSQVDLSLAQERVERYKSEGNAHYNAKRYERALVNYEKATTQDDAHVDTWFNKGRCCHELGMFFAAILAYQKTLNLSPEHAKAFYFFIEINYQKGLSDVANFMKQNALDLPSLTGDMREKITALNEHTVRSTAFSMWDRQALYAALPDETFGEPEETASRAAAAT